MFILVPIIILFLTGLTLLIIRAARPGYQFSWLIAASGSFLAWVSIGLWQLQIPQLFTFSWKPEKFFSYSPTLIVDGISWAFAFSLATIALAVILTSVVRTNVPIPTAWAGTQFLIMFGLVAVLADNPLTLVLAWSAIDLIELIYLLNSVYGPRQSENAVIAFSTRLVGTGILLWASVSSISLGIPLDFESVPPQAGLLLLVSAGLRLGVLPLHMPFTTELVLRRGLGTSLRLVSAASSLILLARIPSSGIVSPLTPYLLILAGLAGVYGGWMWLRAIDELDGRPFWLIGMGSLAVTAALRGNPVGSAAWGIALILSGGLVFLYSVRSKRLNWLVILLVLSITSLPFSLTASGWRSSDPFSWISALPFIPTQVLLIAGYFKQAMRTETAQLSDFPRWAQYFYPLGLVILSIVQVLLGLWGWNGAMQIGVWWNGLIIFALAAFLVWLGRRGFFNELEKALGNFSPSSQVSSNLGRLYSWIWNIYRFLGQISNTIANALEGDGGVIWALLLLVIFISFLQGIQ